MGHFAMLSHRAQVGRLRRVAVCALDSYPLVDPRLSFVTHGENTTFRVEASTPGPHAPAYRSDRFLLRVHRPNRHGRGVDSAAAIASELHWLTALRADTGLSVPVPVLTHDGALTVTVSVGSVPEPRVCSILRWMDGSVRSGSPRPVYLRRLGSAMARMHNHAEAWQRPAGFVRMRWGWETFFGDTMEYGGVNAAEVWNLIPAELRRRFERVASTMERVMRSLGDGPDMVGLIHADLHLDNALFPHGDIRLIDFDDCGVGYWLYDIAVALWELRHRPDYKSFRAALIEGYTQHRALPTHELAHLDDFIATREVAFGLWFVGTAQVNPAFRNTLDRQLAVIAKSLDALSRA